MFRSILPHGIVNCAVVPVPPPSNSSFPETLGRLAPGSYTVTWNIYLDQSPNAPELLTTTSASLVVTGPSTPAVAADPTPSVPVWALAALAALCMFIGGSRLQRQ